jgi:hypothetical protein
MRYLGIGIVAGLLVLLGNWALGTLGLVPNLLSQGVLGGASGWAAARLLLKNSTGSNQIEKSAAP